MSWNPVKDREERRRKEAEKAAAEKNPSSNHPTSRSAADSMVGTPNPNSATSDSNPIENDRIHPPAPTTRPTAPEYILVEGSDEKDALLGHADASKYVFIYVNTQNTADVKVVAYKGVPRFDWWNSRHIAALNAWRRDIQETHGSNMMKTKKSWTVKEIELLRSTISIALMPPGSFSEDLDWDQVAASLNEKMKDRVQSYGDEIARYSELMPKGAPLMRQAIVQYGPKIYLNEIRVGGVRDGAECQAQAWKYGDIARVLMDYSRQVIGQEGRPNPTTQLLPPRNTNPSPSKLPFTQTTIPHPPTTSSAANTTTSTVSSKIASQKPNQKIHNPTTRQNEDSLDSRAKSRSKDVTSKKRKRNRKSSKPDESQRYVRRDGRASYVRITPQPYDPEFDDMTQEELDAHNEAAIDALEWGGGPYDRPETQENVTETKAEEIDDDDGNSEGDDDDSDDDSEGLFVSEDENDDDDDDDRNLPQPNISALRATDSMLFPF